MSDQAVMIHAKPRKGFTMPFFTHPILISPPLARSVAIAALMGTTMLAIPLSAARADTVTNGAFQLAQATAPQKQAAAEATETKGETVEQRITNLHGALKITPDQEKQWNAVAQAMRENAANMDKLVASNRTAPPQNLSAVEDLQTYQKFAQAHVDGLKNLISSFGTLYDAMPAAQKKVADTVFSTAGREPAPTHG
jgi:protein CpxP